MYKLILMDADDTLFDYPKAETQALELTFDFYHRQKDWIYQGSKVTTEALIASYREINHQLWVDLEKGFVTTEEVKILRFKRLFDAFNMDVDAIECSRIYLYNLSQGRFMLDGAVDICAYLHSMAKVLIVTNGFKEVQYSRILESELGQYIDGIIISEEVGVSKPDPRIFAHALDFVGHKTKEDVLMIGDSLTADIAGGSNFGIDTCWYNPRKNSPKDSEWFKSLNVTYEISALNQLKNIVTASK